MSARFESTGMMKRFAIAGLVSAWAITAAACQENPHLRVDVVHPDDIDVATTTITVYQSELFSCTKVELGDLSDDQLAAAKIDEIAIGDGLAADDLTMSRVDPKVIVARGYDAGGAYVSAGCAEKGVVGEGDSLTIETELTATVSVGGIGLDDGDPFGIVVTVTDPLVRSLPDRIVSWRVHGASGAAPIDPTNLTLGEDSDWEPTAAACSNDSGLVRVHPTPPSKVGGFATAVRTSWSTEPPRTFTTFTPIDDSGKIGIDAIAKSQRWCAPRVAGNTRRLVCLQTIAGTVTAVDYTVTVTDGGARIQEVGPGTRQTFPSLPGNEEVLGVFSVERGATTRDVYAMTTKARPFGLFNPSVPATSTPLLTATEDATDFDVLPACGNHKAALLVDVQTTLTREIQALAIDPAIGANLMAYPSPMVAVTDTIGINRTGCLAELVPGGATKIHQVGVIDVTNRAGPGARNTTSAIFDCNSSGGTCVIPIPVPRAGVGFLPADDLHPERLVSTTFDATGAVLAVSVLQADKNGVPRLVELERITAASFPSHVVAGQFDDDGRPDLFWDIVASANNGTSNFQLAYAHQVDGERLSALSATQPDEIVVDTFVADVTGDGLDDLVITSQDRILVQPTVFEVHVIAGQIPIKNFTPVTDPPCGSR